MSKITEDVMQLIRFSFFYASSIRRYEYYRKFRKRLCDPDCIGGFFKANSRELFLQSVNRSGTSVRSIISDVESGRLDLMTIEDQDYPQKLRNIPDPPLLLYIRGDRSLLSEELSISVVGARKTDEYGLDITEKISSELAHNGFVVVSGLAYGVDVASHRAALKATGKTVGVLAADNTYPSSNTEVFRKMCEKGAVVSEYPMGFYVRPDMFLVRNRLIAALSKGTLVVRASLKSGSLSTARAAGEYDRDVFSVPGNDYENLSRGTNDLLKKGAVPVTCGEDILNYYGFEINSSKKEAGVKMDFSDSEKEVLKVLSTEKMTADDISLEMGRDIEEVNSILCVLELKSVLKRYPGNRFKRMDI
ncbi:MAG: DNA-processing protein DprA [Candidatus Muiribacteriaceae bacterium]